MNWVTVIAAASARQQVQDRPRESGSGPTHLGDQGCRVTATLNPANGCDLLHDASLTVESRAPRVEVLPKAVQCQAALTGPQRLGHGCGRVGRRLSPRAGTEGSRDTENTKGSCNSQEPFVFSDLLGPLCKQFCQQPFLSG